uniref:Uncharacterized protein n=1 Tax=Rhizophora mucronata TaxID=61149 RepID=A0A2P2QQA6_RHIMU
MKTAIDASKKMIQSPATTKSC